MLIDILKYFKKKMLQCFFVFIILLCCFGTFQYVNLQKSPETFEENIGIDGYRLLRFDIDSIGTNKAGEALLYNFADLWKRPTLMSEFADYLSENYDMTLLYEEWDDYVIGEQVSTLTQSIEITKIGNLLYELRWYNEVPVSEQTEVDELVNHILDDYIDYIREYTKLSDSNAKFEVVKEKTYIRTELKNQIDKEENLILKICILSFSGAFLITLLLFLVLYACSLKKEQKP